MLKVITAAIIVVVAGVMLTGFFRLSKMQIEKTYVIEPENIAEESGEYFLSIDDHQLTLQNVNDEAIEFGRQYKVLYETSSFNKNKEELLRGDEVSFPPKNEYFHHKAYPLIVIADTLLYLKTAAKRNQISIKAPLLLYALRLNM